MKILYVTTIGMTMGFFKDLIKGLIDKGHIVDIATNRKIFEVPNCYYEWGCKVFDISTSRSPFKISNLRAIKQIKLLAVNYDIVHCHTPVAGIVTRLACRKLRKEQKVKVVYTAHGFHFYNGAPKKNWIFYYPIEKLCSKYTDVLITINKEDYNLAKEKMNSKSVIFIPSVGINTERYSSCVFDVAKKRQELGIPTDAIVLISVGELNKNKNHAVVLKALADLKSSNYHYVIAGEGNQRNKLLKESKKLGVNLHLLGFRKDIPELFKISDINVFPSIREGFGLAAIEGIASGVPTICAKNRGTLTFGNDGENCLFFEHNDYKSLSKLIKYLLGDNKKYFKLANNFQEIRKLYDVASINLEMENLYLSLMNFPVSEKE